MEKIEEELLETIAGDDVRTGAYNIRKNGKGVERQITENVKIETKKDGTGIDIYVKENTKFEIVHIPVIITQSGLKDVVYNDFYIWKNANVVIVADCGIHNDEHNDSQHDGIHHYGEGKGDGKRILNPVTEVELKEGSSLEMESVQIKGVDSTIRETRGKVYKDGNLVVTEKILTAGTQLAKTVFDVDLEEEGASVKVTSRSVATENSKQQFESKIVGNTKCFGHVECDAIIKDNAKVTAIPEIIANNVDANLIHEAAIGKIAGEQLIKLMTLGLTEKEAEEKIIQGFLK